MRVSLSQPSDSSIEAFLQRENEQNFSYLPLHGTAKAAAVPGFDNDHQRVQVGSGQADFAKAKEAIRQWVHFPASWTAILPERAPIVEGAPVAMFFKLFGLWWRNSCRIVYVIDEADRYGFAYGTLPAHIEMGEEVFFVAIDTEGRVWYELQAYSRPRYWMARLGYPLARILQEKFRQDSALAVQRHIQGRAAAFLTPNRWFLHIALGLLAAILLWPGSIIGHDYGKLPLVFAFFIMTPMALMAVQRQWAALQGFAERLAPWMAPAAVLAVASLALETGGGYAIAAATPWLLLCTAIAAAGGGLLWKSRNLSDATAALGCVYAAVGGAWFWADRAGIRPMGFGDDIVRLTALHFHFAGFALPVLTALVARMRPGLLANIACAGVALGVPLTAAGITATQYHMGPFLETLAAIVMSGAGLLTGWLLLRTGGRLRNGALMAAGILLFGTMALAMTYGLRSYLPELALSLDHMRAIHGSLNGLVALPLAFWGIWYTKEIKKDPVCADD